MFFAPLVAPPPAPPAHVVVVAQPVPIAPPLVPLVPVGPLGQPVTVPQAYQFGACQAIHRIAWDLAWSFDGHCARYNRTTPLPLRFGKLASAADWLDTLTQQLPAGVRVTVNPVARNITVSP